MLKRKIINVIVLSVSVIVVSEFFNQAFSQSELTVNNKVISLVPQVGHYREIVSIDFSSDGSTFVTGSNDNNIVLWDSTGTMIRSFTGHLEPVTDVKFSSDDEYIVSCSLDGTVRKWDILTGEEINIASLDVSKSKNLINKILVGDEVDLGINSIAMEKGYDHIICGTQNGIFCLKFDPKPVFTRIEEPQITAKVELMRMPSSQVLFCSENNYVFSSDFQDISIWNVQNGIHVGDLEGHDEAITKIVLCEEGKYLYSSSNDSSIIKWDIKSREKVDQYFFNEQIADIAIAPDNTYLAAITKSELIILNLSTKNQQVIHEYSRTPSSVIFDPSGQLLFVGNYSYITVWEMPTWRLVELINSYMAVPWDMSLFGDTLYIASENNVWVLDMLMGELQSNFSHQSNDNIKSISTNNNGRFLLSGTNNDIILWNTSTGKQIKSFITDSSMIRSLEFSSKGNSAISGHSDGRVYLWNTGKYIGDKNQSFGDILGTNVIDEGLNFANFCPDDEHFITGSSDALELWDWYTLKNPKQYKRNNADKFINAQAIDFSPNNKYMVAGSLNGHMLLWETYSTRELMQFYHGDWNYVNSTIFAPDGNSIFSAAKDNNIYWWDINNNKIPKFIFEGHNDQINTIIASPDLKYLFSSSLDGKINIWDLQSKELLLSILILKELYTERPQWVAVTPDGHFETNNLETLKGLYWVISDDPLHPLPIEIFTRDYFEPNLIAKVLSGQKFATTENISLKNRVQPEVKILKVNYNKEKPDSLEVHIWCNNMAKKIVQGGVETESSSGIYDLRLFRDNQLVGQFPKNSNESKMADYNNYEENLNQWREKFQIKTSLSSDTTIIFKIRTPSRANIENFELSAYAFNSDRVKSITSRSAFLVPEELERNTGKLYLISLGINPQNPNWNLPFVINDAKEFGSRLYKLFKSSNQFNEVVPINVINQELPLTKSNNTNNFIPPTKSNIQSVFKLLSGEMIIDTVSDDFLKQTLSNIKQTSPNDAVILYCSSHGITDKYGNFYIVPYDIGYSTSNDTISPELLSRSISSFELSNWLLDIDVGHSTAIIDACYSQAAVITEGFIPGPMGDRSLGQLAYDKGMQILVATQLDKTTTQSSNGGGLSDLTNALLNEGIDNKQLRDSQEKLKLSDILQLTQNKIIKIQRGKVKNEGKILKPIYYPFANKKYELWIN